MLALSSDSTEKEQIPLLQQQKKEKKQAEEAEAELDKISAQLSQMKMFMALTLERKIALFQRCQEFKIYEDLQEKVHDTAQKIGLVAWKELVASLQGPSQKDEQVTLDHVLTLLSNQIYSPVIDEEEKRSVLSFCAKVQEQKLELFDKIEAVSRLLTSILLVKSGNMTESKSRTYHYLEEDGLSKAGTSYNMCLGNFLPEELLTQENILALENYLANGEIEIKESNLEMLVLAADFWQSQDLVIKIEEWVEHHKENIRLNVDLLEKLYTFGSCVFDEVPTLRQLIFTSITGCLTNNDLLTKLHVWISKNHHTISSNSKKYVLPGDLEQALKKRHECCLDVITDLREYIPEINLKGAARRDAVVLIRTKEAQLLEQTEKIKFQKAKELNRDNLYHSLTKDLWGYPLIFAGTTAIFLTALWGLSGMIPPPFLNPSIIGYGSLIGAGIGLVVAIVIILKLLVTRANMQLPNFIDPFLQKEKARLVCSDLRQMRLANIVIMGYTGKKLCDTGFISEEDALRLDALIQTPNDEAKWEQLRKKIVKDLPY